MPDVLQTTNLRDQEQYQRAQDSGHRNHQSLVPDQQPQYCPLRP